MDPMIGNSIIALIQIVAELARQAGMTEEQVNQHFVDSWKKIQGEDPDKLPDAGETNG